MDESSKFVLTMTRYIITGFLVLVMACAGSCQASRYQMRKVLEAGIPPMAAKCALVSDATDCVLLYAAEANKQ